MEQSLLSALHKHIERAAGLGIRIADFDINEMQPGLSVEGGLGELTDLMLDGAISLMEANTGDDKKISIYARLRDWDVVLGDKVKEQSEEPTPIKAKHAAAEIEIGLLVPFHGHPFRLYEGERLDDMVESVRNNGVLIPIIVRRGDKDYEILSGHNRVNASKLAGLAGVPAIVLENITDDEAWVYVIETNLMQRSFSEMLFSEKAAVITTQHSKMFSQGKRNDILAELKTLENPHEYSVRGTFPQVGERLHSDKKVGEMYSLSKNTIARYLRVHQLCPRLKQLLDNGQLAFIPAVEISFLRQNEQEELAVCLLDEGLKVDMKKADTLRDCSRSGKLTAEVMRTVLSGGMRKKPASRTPAVKVRKEVYARYFTPTQSAKDVQKIVEKALELYFSQ